MLALVTGTSVTVATGTAHPKKLRDLSKGKMEISASGEFRIDGQVVPAMDDQ
jgi:hypothetical protein